MHPSAPKTGPRPWLLAVGVVLVVVCAGVAALWYAAPLFNSKGNTGMQVRGDGPTLYEALSEANATESTFPGGPWTLFTVYGIASPAPFDPNALGWTNNSAVVNSCQGLFNGLTIWNGTIPLFNGTFNSGTAPFWQVFYFSNSSQSILVISDVMGVTQGFPPMAMNSSCAVNSGLAITPWAWGKEFSPLLPDSPILAATAWAAIGPSWSEPSSTSVETYRLGNGWWGGSRPEGRVVELGRCGVVGATASQPIQDAVFAPNGSIAAVYGGSVGCGNVRNDGPPLVLYMYNLNFTVGQVVENGATALAPLSLTTSAGNQTTGSFPDPAGVVSWIVDLSLESSAGSRVTAGPSGCPAWVRNSVNDCVANPAGWYAVLLSQNGSWLDSFGATGSGDHWTLPTVSLVSNQQLVLVYPSSWSLTGDTLEANSTTPDAPLSGSTGL